MRNAIIASIVVFSAQASLACTCLSPTRLAESARQKLPNAKYAVHVHVEHIALDGKATLRVIESFRGSSPGTTIEITPEEDRRCGKLIFAAGEDAVLVSYSGRMTFCSKYAPEPFLLEAFREAVAK